MSTSIIVLILLSVLIVIIAIALIIAFRYHTLTKIYYLNSNVLRTIDGMPFIVKLKRLDALAQNNSNSSHEREYDHLSIDFEELKKRSEKIRKTNEVYLNMIRGFSFSKARQLDNETIQSELKDLKLEAFTLTKKLDELTYTSTVSELVAQQITYTFNNILAAYKDIKKREKRYPEIEKRIKEQLIEIEELFKTYKLNDQTRKHDDNLQVLGALTEKVKAFTLTSMRHSRMKETLEKLIIKKVEKANDRVSRYPYIFESSMDILSNYNESINSMIQSTRTMVVQDNYEVLYNNMKELLNKVFEFNFWVKFQLSGAKTISNNNSNLGLDMNSIEDYHVKSLRRIVNTNYLDDSQKREVAYQLNSEFENVKKAYKNYVSTNNAASVNVDLKSQFNYLVEYFDARAKYNDYADNIEKDVNTEIKSIINYRELIKDLNKEFLALRWLINKTDMELDSNTKVNYDTLIAEVSGYISEERIEQRDIDSGKIQLVLEELQDEVSYMKDFIILNTYLKDMSEKVERRVTRLAEGNNEIKEYLDKFDELHENGEYFNALDTLLKITKIYNLNS